jgi:hypothetical protein
VRGLHDTIDISEGCSLGGCSCVIICCAENVLELLDVGKGTVDVMSMGGQDAN